MIYNVLHIISPISLLILAPYILKKTEIDMKPNKAYETVTRPQSAEQVHTEPCSAYEVPTI